MKIRFSKILILTFGIIFIGFSCKKTKADPAVVVPNNASDFALFFESLTKAKLIDTLKTTGPYMIFALKNDNMIRANLAEPAKVSRDVLLPILSLHIADKAIKYEDFNTETLKTFNKTTNIYISKNSNGVFINGNIRVKESELTASNGVIYEVDKILLVPNKNMKVMADSLKDFSEFLSLVALADPKIQNSLSTVTEKGLTVFMPTNAAFKELYKTIPKADFIKASFKSKLTEILSYHIIQSRIFTPDFPNLNLALPTLNTVTTLNVKYFGGEKVIGQKSGESNVTVPNQLATNGVIHGIDKVLLFE
jgi:uncharacterized surface protein with fasciclin (FAS1) repeats